MAESSGVVSSTTVVHTQLQAKQLVHMSPECACIIT